MKNSSLILFFSLILPSVSGLADQEKYGHFDASKLSTKKEIVIVGWNTKEGQQRLLQSKYNNDYFQLAHNFQPQANPLYCSIATSVMVLNSMRLPKNSVPSQTAFEIDVPKSLGGGRLTYPTYSQATFLGEKTNKVKAKEIIELNNQHQGAGKLDPGLTLLQLKNILKIYDTKVELFYADKKTGVNIFRERIKNALKEDKQFVILNFNGQTIGAPTHGHVSPISAYHEKTDSVLILDVAGYLNPWYWVPIEHIYNAMHTKDGKAYRGYLLVSDI